MKFLRDTVTDLDSLLGGKERRFLFFAGGPKQAVGNFEDLKQNKASIQKVLFEDLDIDSQLTRELAMKDSEFTGYINKLKNWRLDQALSKVKGERIDTTLDGSWGSSSRLVLAYLQFKYRDQVINNKSVTVDGLFGEQSYELLRMELGAQVHMAQNDLAGDIGNNVISEGNALYVAHEGVQKVNEDIAKSDSQEELSERLANRFEGKTKEQIVAKLKALKITDEDLDQISAVGIDFENPFSFFTDKAKSLPDIDRVTKLWQFLNNEPEEGFISLVNQYAQSSKSETALEQDVDKSIYAYFMEAFGAGAEPLEKVLFSSFDSLWGDKQDMEESLKILSSDSGASVIEKDQAAENIYRILSREYAEDLKNELIGLEAGRSKEDEDKALWHQGKTEPSQREKSLAQVLTNKLVTAGTYSGVEALDLDGLPFNGYELASQTGDKALSGGFATLERRWDISNVAHERSQGNAYKNLEGKEGTKEMLSDIMRNPKAESAYAHYIEANFGSKNLVEVKRPDSSGAEYHGNLECALKLGRTEDISTWEALKKQKPKGKEVSSAQLIASSFAQHGVRLENDEFEEAFSDFEEMKFEASGLREVINKSAKDSDIEGWKGLGSKDPIIKLTPVQKEEILKLSDGREMKVEGTYQLYLRKNCANPLIVGNNLKITYPADMEGLDLPQILTEQMGTQSQFNLAPIIIALASYGIAKTGGSGGGGTPPGGGESKIVAGNTAVSRTGFVLL